MTQKHDSSYRRLFAEPRMIRDLVRGYLREPWAERLDLGTLQRSAEARIGPGLRKRRSDLVWKLKIRSEPGEQTLEEWLYIFLLLEFQSEPDRDMALRLLTYLGLFYQDLRREPPHRKGLLPPVLPIVLYNGGWRWKAPRDVAGLVQTVSGLDRYRPRLEYLLLEERHLPERTDNLASVLFALEECRSPEEIDRRVAQLSRLLPDAEDASLRSAFMDFLKFSLLKARFPDADIPNFRDLEEMRPMLRENMINWAREFEQKGRQEGEAALLLRLLERRFGNLDPDIRSRVENADADKLLEWGERFVEARTLGDIFYGPS